MYVENSQEERWLKKAQKGKQGVILANNVDDIIQYINNL